MSITFTTAANHGPTLNLSNGNAAQILDLLGLPVEPDGTAPAEDFLGRVLLAQALAGHAADDTRGRPAVREGNWTECGRRPGYLAEKLTELHQIATWASKHYVPVWWS